jgi:1,4-alpha-glucan branching enzyme
MKTTAYLAFVLHAHLPFIRHPEHEDFLEEDWLFEAITETYIPLLTLFQRLEQDKIPFHLTLTLTPTLCEMLTDPLLCKRYARHLRKLVKLTHLEQKRYGSEDQRNETAHFYHEHFLEVERTFFEVYHEQILPGFRYFQEQGFLEIVTCGATHGYFPLMKYPQSRRAQIRIAKDNYLKHFGREPRGIWLPECGYHQGIEKDLEAEGIRFFFVDSHGVLFGEPRPTFGIYQPVYCTNGVAAFARDIDTSKQVWSSDEGYPGDPFYREFYRDLGYDGDYEYIKPFLHPDGVRRNIGIKYHRVTGRVDLSKKEKYSPRIAKERAFVHAGHFLESRRLQSELLRQEMGVAPLIVSPYDAELFGHWWFEGPWFIENIFRLAVHYPLVFTTPYLYLKQFPVQQHLQPNTSSWGEAGYSQQWLNPTNAWIYRHLHQAEHRFLQIIKEISEPSALQKRVFTQAARELLLAQSSDWAFILSTGTTVEYATKRIKDHLHRFDLLYQMIRRQRIHTSLLEQMEGQDNIFAELNYQAYQL